MADDNVEYRIGQLEKDVSEVKVDIREILENHLPHLDKKVAVLIAQMVILMGGVGYLISIVVSVLKCLP